MRTGSNSTGPGQGGPGHLDSPLSASGWCVGPSTRCLTVGPSPHTIACPLSCQPVPLGASQSIISHQDSPIQDSAPPNSAIVPPEPTFIFLEAVSTFSRSCRPLGARSVGPGLRKSVPVFLGREPRAQIEISTEEASSSAPPGHCVRRVCMCVGGGEGSRGRAETRFLHVAAGHLLGPLPAPGSQRPSLWAPGPDSPSPTGRLRCPCALDSQQPRHWGGLGTLSAAICSVGVEGATPQPGCR